MSDVVLQCEHLTKTYQSGERPLTVLDDVSFSAVQGTSLAIIGPSGSGKTTLLGLCAGLDIPTSGVLSLMGFKLNAMNEDDRAYVRNQFVGFVFQNFQLLPTLTALENVMVPLELRGEKNISTKAKDLLARVGLEDRFHHFPTQLSGGEQQRVALARAFITSPRILFADEPTGNLDEENAHQITDLIFAMNRQEKTTLILVTHNLELAEKTERILQMKGGKLVNERVTGLAVS
ncbi:MAG: ABC transporter ATP-binding protein [Cytophagales bacterium]|nr:ABC transporter ATP-binding protein [Cytophagales bacterium]MCA6386780.1 ABC transporter ATP-binding protein [Cytophagales bacterium]MCA6391647.1 ABC transporter ATP-binding protein [Cytophagales bacterium]MCA6394024.1 ABC transporter ATP-binding protein [Cytophagales bacterium]MCA6399254.1 ABC transporter ATP-binding protein [Cytophagales bacterium]